MYAVLASADLAVVLAVSLGAVLVAIAVIIALVFVASRRRRARQYQRRMKENHSDVWRPGSAFTRSSASHPGIALNDARMVVANGGQHHVLQRAASSASSRQLNVGFAPTTDVNIELEVLYGHLVGSVAQLAERRSFAGELNLS